MGGPVPNDPSPLQTACDNFLFHTTRDVVSVEKDEDDIQKQLSLVVSLVNDETSYPAVPDRLPWRTVWVLHGAFLEHLQIGGFKVAKQALLQLMGSMQLVAVVLIWLCAQHAASSRPIAELLSAFAPEHLAIMITNSKDASEVTIDVTIKPSQLVADAVFAVGLVCACLSMCMNLGAVFTLSSTWNFVTFRHVHDKWGTMSTISVIFLVVAAHCAVVAFIVPIWAVCTLVSLKMTMCMQLLAAVAICVVQAVIVGHHLEHMALTCVCLSKTDIKYHLRSRLLGRTWSSHPAEVLAAVKDARDLCDTLSWLATVKHSFLDELLSCIMFWPAGVRVEQELGGHTTCKKVTSALSIVVVDKPATDKNNCGDAPCDDILKPLLA